MTRAPAWRGARLFPAGLALALLPAAPAAADSAAPAPAAPDAPPARAARAAHTVTLVTGDRVTVTELPAGKKAVTVDRPEGATGAVRTQVAGGRITVVPDEARPYLRAGTLDRRLFDVTELIRQGFAEEKGEKGEKGEESEKNGKGGAKSRSGAARSLPLILTYAKGQRARDGLPRGVAKVRALPSVHGAAVTVADGRGFWRELTRGAAASPYGKRTSRLLGGIGKVWLDGRVRADLAQSNEQIGTPKAWDAGLTGKGVKVAVLDTGVDAGHPDLKGRVGETKSFIPGEGVDDRNGHGTHVTSTVGGSGAASDGKEKGVAPGVSLAVGKVLGDEGSGSESQIIAGMEWAAKDVDAKVVSMSLGSPEPSDGTDPMAAAVDSLSRETGALFVIAAGNTGAPSSIGSPGAADAALTVGAVDSADKAAYFTSQGPRAGDHALKPDLSAPGVDILAARSRLAPGSGDYTTMSGTSMATPHIAGAAALLAERHPDWSGQRIKDALMSTSQQLDATAYELGAGRVSVPDAVEAPVTATGAADFGFYGWPYEGNEPVTRTLTYANSSDKPVELTLAVQGATNGVVSLADTSLTVPAHGTASTTATGDGAGAAVGTTSGRIVASTAGKAVAHTVFGLVKEGERYTLTVRVKDRGGDPAAAGVTVQELASGAEPIPAGTGDDGTLKLRLKPGAYSVASFLDVAGVAGAAGGKDSLGLGFLAAPQVDLDRDREVVLDGRKLRELKVDVGRRGTERRQAVMEYDRQAGGAQIQQAVQLPVTYDRLYAAPTGKVTKDSFEYRTVWRLGKPLLDVKGLGETVAQPGGTVPGGRDRLRIVDAGRGTAADYEGKDVRGKAVVVRRRAGSGAPTPAQLGQAAQEAGARALFVTDDVPGRLNAWFGTEGNEDRPLAVGTVNAADGARLVEAARKGRTVEVTGTPDTPYVYDVSRGYQGSVPTGSGDLTYRPGRGELASLDTEFHAFKPMAGGEFRYSVTDTFTVGLGFPEKVGFPARRTDYVSTGAGQLWHESVSAGPGALEERSGLVRYRGGERTGLNWFKPVWHPWLGTGLGWGQQRSGDQLQFNTPGWGDSGPDHTGFGDVWNDGSMTQFTEVYADGELVDRKQSSGVYVRDADPAERTYKVVTDTALDGERWGLATKGHSEWTVRSAETPAGKWTYLPVLNLGFDVDTDLRGAVRGGERVPVGIHSAYVRGAAGAGEIRGGTLEVSYDGGTSWRGVALERDGRKAAWGGVLKVPGGAESVSLRAAVVDDRGGSVTQEIVRAVGVK